MVLAHHNLKDIVPVDLQVHYFLMEDNPGMVRVDRSPLDRVVDHHSQDNRKAVALVLHQVAGVRDPYTCVVEVPCSGAFHRGRRRQADTAAQVKPLRLWTYLAADWLMLLLCWLDVLGFVLTAARPGT